jgi:hypothetical protein
MKNKFFAALLVGTVVFGAAAAMPAEAKNNHNKALNMMAMQMYAQQLAQQGQPLAAQQWGAPYYNQNLNPYGANYGYGYDPYLGYSNGSFYNFNNLNPYANPYATPFAAYGANPYGNYNYTNLFGFNNNPYANPYQQTGWRGQLSNILNGWF